MSYISKFPTLLGFISTTTSVFLVSHLVSLNIPITTFPGVIIQAEIKTPTTTTKTPKTETETQEKPKQKEEKSKNSDSLTTTLLKTTASATSAITNLFSK